jgi:hypothetical protein
MSKRFSILAAALVASGRSHSTIISDRLDPRPAYDRARRIEDLSIEERGRYAFDDPEEETPRSTVSTWGALVWDL